MQEDSAEQSYTQAKEILQQAILRDYPNPERRGCPGFNVLRRLASFDLPQTSDPAWEHVIHCSPCYAEFLGFRAETKVVRRRGRQRMRLIFAAAAVVIVLCGMWLAGRQFLGPRGQVPPQIAANVPPTPAYLDLEPIEISRGGSDGEGKHSNLVLPVGDLDLRIRLPIGSEDGRYQVQILSQPGGRPLAFGQGAAALEEHSVLLTTRLNLKGLKPGNYYMAFRRVNLDWAMLPLELKK